jgi:hypothetical protein
MALLFRCIRKGQDRGISMNVLTDIAYTAFSYATGLVVATFVLGIAFHLMLRTFEFYWWCRSEYRRNKK